MKVMKDNLGIGFCMYIFGYRAELVPMSGVASDTGNMSPTMVAKIVIDNIIVTPAR